MGKLFFVFCLIWGYVEICQGKGEYGQVYFQIEAPCLTSADTLELRIWENIVYSETTSPHRVFVAENNQGTYVFRIDSVSSYSRASLHLGYQKINGKPKFGIFELLLMMPGDSIHVTLKPVRGVAAAGRHFDGGVPLMVSNWTIDFRGKGAVRFRASYELDCFIQESERASNERNPASFLMGHPEWIRWRVTELNNIETRALKRLGDMRSSLPTETYRLLGWDVIAKCRILQIQTIRNVYRNHLSSDTNYSFLKAFYAEKLYTQRASLDSIRQRTASRSPHLIRYLNLDTELGHYFLFGNYRLGSLYPYMKQRFPPGPVRDRAMAALLLNRFHYEPDNVMLSDATNLITDRYSSNRLKGLDRILKGTPAFPFELLDSRGNVHRLTDYIGKVVLIDFWYLACMPCSAYMKHVLHPVIDEFKDDERVVFISISLDDRESLVKALSRPDFLSRYALHLTVGNERFEHPIVNYYGINSYPFPLLIDRSGYIFSSGLELRDTNGLKETINCALSR